MHPWCPSLWIEGAAHRPLNLADVFAVTGHSDFAAKGSERRWNVLDKTPNLIRYSHGIPYKAGERLTLFL
jgi:hypothetical protein